MWSRERHQTATGPGLILFTHEPDHAARLATRMLTLDDCGETWNGSPAEATVPGRLARLYCF